MFGPVPEIVNVSRGKAIIVLIAVFFNDDDVTVTLHYQKATFPALVKIKTLILVGLHMLQPGI